MKIMTVANRKGGVGKSTCAAHLAYAAVSEGKKVILIDMDPQGTLEKWWGKREDDNPFFVEVVNSNVSGVIEKLRLENFDLCIIDTPGDASVNAIEGIKASDLVVIPTKPTPADLSVIGRTICMVEENKKKFVFLITQGVIRTKATLQAASVLSQFGAVAPAVLSHRVSYASAMGTGQSAATIDKQAQEEVFQVWEFIKKRLFEETTLKKSKIVYDN